MPEPGLVDNRNDCACQHSDGMQCPAQILVLDRSSGPAALVMDLIARLIDRTVCVTWAVDDAEARQALAGCEDDYDLVMVGLSDSRLSHVAIISYIHASCPELPILVVGQHLSPQVRHAAEHYGATRVVPLPERAAELKELLGFVTQKLLVPNPVSWTPAAR